MLIKKIFSKASNSCLCNTSYPLAKENWNMYRKDNFELFKDEQNLSIYIHIPFCRKMCSFCEYIKFPKMEESVEKNYISILEKDIDKFIKNNNNFTLCGLDIGGGTPTVLSDDSFFHLMKISKRIMKLKCVKDFEPSIEGTFDTLTEEKIKAINEAGFTRISLGIQTTNLELLKKNNRENLGVDGMINIVKTIRENGIEKINIDFMYGLANQTLNDLKESLKIIYVLDPNQVTLYEMRYNMLLHKQDIDKKYLYKQYKLLYKELLKLGYIGRFGQNTFTKEERDLGLSSYLRYRMIENISYKGFGISAQSKSKLGVSYNIGKNRESLSACLDRKSFSPSDIYELPYAELLAKYIAISLYYGSFKLSIMRDIINDDPLEIYKKHFQFLKKGNYITIDGDIVSLTEKGFKYYGSIGALFYSLSVQKWLLGSD